MTLMTNMLNSKKVVFLTNIIPPYRLCLFRLITKAIPKFKILASSENEKNRKWNTSYDGINVEIQKGLSLSSLNFHPSGFKDGGTIHIPIDTFFKLFSNKPDVIVSAELGMRSLFSVVYKWINPSTRLIIYADLSDYTELGRGRVRYLLRKMIVNNVDSVIVNGMAGKRYMQNSLSYHESINIVPYPTDELFLSNYVLKKSVNTGGEYQFVLVGQMIPRKGYLEFITVLNKYVLDKNIKVHLVFIGDGELMESISSMSNNKVRITCTGHISYDQLFHYYKNSDISILPTLADTWALVVNESMACGVPVLGSKYSQAVEEMIIHRENGWVYDPLIEGDLELVLDNIFNDDINEIEAFSRKANDTAIEYSVKNVADKMISAIQCN